MKHRPFFQYFAGRNPPHRSKPNISSVFMFPITHPQPGAQPDAPKAALLCRLLPQRWAPQMRMHTKKLFVGLGLLLIGAVASAGVIELGLMSKLHNASKDIKQHTNHGAVVESIYKQIRSRANVTNTTLNVAEIDRIVRSYVSEKYAPALITNYAQLYSQLKAEKTDFSTCDALHPFNLTN